jgi:hypothetical protein
MTRGQQAVLLVMVALVVIVMGLLAYTLLTSEEAAPEVPTLAVLRSAMASPTRPPAETATAVAVPPTWTPEPTRTGPATNTPRGSATATGTATITPTFLPTFTPRPTEEVTATPPGPTGTLGLVNPGFEGVRNDSIPGWSWWAEDNYTPGGAYDPDASFETPLFTQADDARRFINGPTLQIDAVQHLKFRVHVFQTVEVSPTARVGFQVWAGAFSDSGVIQVGAGIDAEGGPDCANAEWSEYVFLDQNQAAQLIVAPEVVAGSAGRVTVCLYAEPFYPAISNAAFFDDAELTVRLE